MQGTKVVETSPAFDVGRASKMSVLTSLRSFFLGQNIIEPINIASTDATFH